MKKLSSKFKLVLNFFVIVLCGISSSISNANKLSPPSELTYKDKAEVDLLTGLPTFHHTDLKIGSGELSLTHTYSSNSGYFSNIWDLSKSYVDSASGSSEARVRLGMKTHDFKFINGSWWPESSDGSTLTGNNQSGWVFIDRDGTTYYYGAGQNKIIYPNGFSIEIGTNYLATNTGLQFRYNYAADPSGIGNTIKDITAINSAYVYCNLAEKCNFSTEWPKASYRWINKEAPIGQEYMFEVTDAEGVKTTYVHKNFRLSVTTATPPRVIRVYESGNSEASRFYTYYENKSCVPVQWNGNQYFWACSGPILIVDTAKIYGNKFSYFWSSTDGVYSSTTGRVESMAGNASISSTSYKGMRAQLQNSSWKEGSASYDGTSVNRISKLEHKGSIYIYDYDNRGNIIKRTRKPNQTVTVPVLDDIIEEAGYSSICNNRKTCNKPNWTTDGKGNITDYEYHAESGQISKVTKPADSNGIRPVTFYKYEQKFARYFVDNGNTLQLAKSAVWLLVSEVQCISKAATSDGCQGGDAITTNYEYGSDTGPNNLWLTGKVVVSPSGSQRRTCYEYDKRGNKIGETQPNANVTSCQ